MYSFLKIQTKDLIVEKSTRYSSVKTLKKLKRQRKRKYLLCVLAAVAVSVGFMLSPLSKHPNSTTLLNHTNDIELGNFPIVEPTIKYGYVTDTLHVSEDVIQPNQFLADILLKHQVSYKTIDEIATHSKEIFDVTKLRAGKPYAIIGQDSLQAPDVFIYEPSVFRYVVYNLKNPSDIQIIEREVETKVKTASGIVETSLWNTMVDNGLSYELTSLMEDALAWSIDFHHIARGDKFKLIYDQQYIEGEPVGVGEVYAAYYKNFDNEYYAIYFENEKHQGFYDLEGRPMKKAFLKSPVRFSRISSSYNKRRFHPVLKRVKAHLGTDYAAPTGTPILAVADGVVTKRSRTRGNGKFVKIKHDESIQTQYLHMSRFQSGVRVGTHVKQGQVIGYVGQTGLATGPHVCFRFWKNGKQVNHLKENLPPPEPMPEEDLPRYYHERDLMVNRLNVIEYNTTSLKKAEDKIAKDTTASNITAVEVQK